MAADLVRRQVAVIAAPGGTPATLAAKRATATIPVVFLTGADPVALGLVESINRPGGNLTGLSQLNAAMVAKRLELMRELLPAASIIALLVNPANQYTDFEATEVRDAAQSLGLGLRVLNASREAEIDAAFATVAKERISALVVSPDPYLTTRRDQVVAQSARHGIAVISDRREFVAAGGLMSYGTDFGDAYHETAVYVGRILKGTKPAELPVQQAVKIQFAINLKTAKSLGLTFPIPLLGRADEVIE
jgi:putative tryptophan/tyrosine transport system substrate-binding protein